MKTLKSIIFSVALAGGVLASCTDVELKQVEHIGGHNTSNSEASKKYYEDLRAYKATAWNYGRPVAFGWFSNWSPAGTYRRGYLSSMPDSMDIVSMWSGAPNRFEITPEQKKDKEFVQRVKGIKLLEVSLLSYLGKGRTPNSVYEPVEKQAEQEGWSESKLEEEKKKARWKYWGFNGELESENHYQALSTFAKALCDSLIANDWDGYDIDWEIGSGVFDMDGTLETTDHLVHLVKEMNKYIGPKSDPEGKGHKLICIDGHFGSLLQPLDGYVDYFIIQSYGRVTNLDNYNCDPKRLIMTENFEADAKSGGTLLRQAEYMPTKGYKGGVGAYRFDNDYDNEPDYRWMREAIRINQESYNQWKANGGEEYPQAGQE